MIIKRISTYTSIFRLFQFTSSALSVILDKFVVNFIEHAEHVSSLISELFCPDYKYKENETKEIFHQRTKYF